MTGKTPEIITLKQLCDELKIDPREARGIAQVALRHPIDTQSIM